jgi:hypothetical protein
MEGLLTDNPHEAHQIHDPHQNHLRVTLVELPLFLEVLLVFLEGHVMEGR